MKLNNLASNLKLWKIIAFALVTSSFLTLILVIILSINGYFNNSLVSPLSNVIFYLIIELPIFLISITLPLLKWKWLKILSLIGLIVQAFIIISLFSGSSSSGYVGTAGTNLFTKWEKKTPIDIFKTDYTAPNAFLTAPVGTFCAIENPRCGYISGKLLISADVTDNIGIKDAKIYLDNTLLKDFTSPPYDVLFDFGTVSKGPHNITVYAKDYAGNTTNESIQLTVE